MKNIPSTSVLFFTSPRFKNLGQGTKKGTYFERKEKESDHIIKEFSQVVEIKNSTVCYSKEDAISAVTLLKNERVDMVTVMFLSWSEDEAWINTLNEISDVPVFYTSIVRDNIDYENTFDEDDFVDFLSYGSLVGFLVGSGSLKRFAPASRRVFIGSIAEVKEELSIFARAAMAKNRLKGAVISLLSHYNEAMWATYVDPYNIFKVFGAQLKFIAIPELIREIEKVDDSEVLTHLEALKKKYRVLPDVEEDKFFASVKATLGMEKAALNIDTDLLVLNDIEKPVLEEVGLRPGFSPLSKDREITVVPEGDLGAGIALYILKLISGERANFIEPFYIDGKRNVFVAGHAGPNDYTQTPENVIIDRDTRFAKSNYKYAGAPFAWYVFPEGIKTILHVSECNGKIKMAFLTVECLKTKHYLASYSHADFRHTSLDNKVFFKKLAEMGVTQHFAIVDGDYTKVLECFAQLYGFEYLNV